MRTRTLLSAGALLATLLLAGTASAAPLLRVQILPETRDYTIEPMKGFSPLYIPMGDETQAREVLVEKYKGYTVSLLGDGTIVGKKMPKGPANLSCRIRSVTPEQQAYPYYEVYRAWVGSSKGLSLQVEGLRPRTKYAVTFYAYDFGIPGQQRMGANHIEDALNPSVKPAKIKWDSETDVLTPKSPLKQKAVTLVSTSSTDGRVLFSITSDDPAHSALLNAFEIEESK
jgi:hypothetical protein